MLLKASLIVLVLAYVATASEDYEYEGWSDNTYLDVVHHMHCNQSYSNLSISLGDTLEWSKHGHDQPIMTDEHYELQAENGIANMILTFKSVKTEQAGIYFCKVMSSGEEIGRTIKALNIGGHLYNDNIDKYDDNIVVGVIAGASVFVLITGVCFIERFRYLTDEQKQKKRDQKEERLRRLERIRNDGQPNGQANDAYDNNDDVRGGKNSNSHWNGNQTEANTHL